MKKIVLLALGLCSGTVLGWLIAKPSESSANENGAKLIQPLSERKVAIMAASSIIHIASKIGSEHDAAPVIEAHLAFYIKKLETEIPNTLNTEEVQKIRQLEDMYRNRSFYMEPERDGKPVLPE